jgi:membrane protein
VLFVSIGNLFGSQPSLILGALQIVLSFALTAILFSIIYKMLPDTKIAWKDVMLAAVITSAVSTALDYLFGVYIRTFPATSLAGTAGAIIVLLLWIFVTYEFILFGAQFSKSYDEMIGSRYRIIQGMKNLQKK